MALFSSLCGSIIFRTWFGLLEFVILSAIVFIVSYLGTLAVTANFMRDPYTGQIRTAMGSGGRMEQALYSAFKHIMLAC
uniref:Wsv216-like protein n=1 Tax=Sicyonia whispovirus TaxID=2984283 RepID=A0A9C7EZ45_9VIRU|nr:MAG: wsv216-like protein [Sicyonia whispovirus]